MTETFDPSAIGIGMPCWHIHHDKLLEWTTESLANRIEYILAEKPERERAIRIRLLRLVAHPERLPEAYADAGLAFAEAERAYAEAWKACSEPEWARDEAASKTYAESWKAYAEAWKACSKASKARAEAEWVCVEAERAHRQEIEALHRAECPNCPWDGTTIFSEGTE